MPHDALSHGHASPLCLSISSLSRRRASSDTVYIALAVAAYLSIYPSIHACLPASLIDCPPVCLPACLVRSISSAAESRNRRRIILRMCI
ncbi:hypothetical protein Mapa_007166 [Marchantia paleacea]|nr:hypothetical protein Mapa_007166 [Marchantia paleacea]